MKVNFTIAGRLSFSLVMLTMSVLLMADFFGLNADENEGESRSRKKFGEAVAVQLVDDLSRGDSRRLKYILNRIKEGNQNVLSIALHDYSGRVIADTGNYREFWSKSKSIRDAHKIRVKILEKNRLRGELLIGFEPLDQFKLFGYEVNKIIVFLAFVGLACFVFYRILLKRILKVIDPSNVVPGRVRKALDLLSEGVIILDNKNRVVMTNESFVTKTHLPMKKIIGKSIMSLPWVVGEAEDNQKLPWENLNLTNTVISGHRVELKLDDNKTTKFIVNCSPIMDGEGLSKGILVTFDDVTNIEKKNVELKAILEKLKKTQFEVKEKNEELKILAAIDPLTGCLNRREFMSRFVGLYNNAKDNGLQLSCIMMDIDYFKRINDKYGHAVGDIVIKTVAEMLKENVREEDVVCRYGGEEFCVVLADTGMREAKEHAERIRKLLERYRYRDNKALKSLLVTASFGVTDFQENPKSPDDMVEQADKALYLAKEQGRNQVICINDEIDNSRINDLGANYEIYSRSVDYARAEHDEIVESTTDRNKFMNVLDKIIEEENPDNVALILVDINMFKRINIALGNRAGDIILDEVQERLASIFREKDIVKQLTLSDEPVAHLSGGEFCAVIKDVPSSKLIEQLVNRLIKTVTASFNVNGCNLQLACNVGVAVYPNDEQTADELMCCAEVALLHAKKTGRNTSSRYTKNIDKSTPEHLELEYEVIRALQENELAVYYQPKLDLKTGNVVGFEALLRWNNPRNNVINTAQFITLAEETGQIHAIGEWVLEQACMQMRQWRDMGFERLSMSVNVSSLQFRKNNLQNMILDKLNKLELEPHYLEIEITEGTVMENLEFVVDTLNVLHNYGVKISIDDFGKGYSSLSYIKQLPIDTIKIDQMFIEKIASSEDDVSIVTAIIAMGHALNMNVLAEGVSMQEQRDIIAELNCDQMQGFLISRALPDEQATAFLTDYQEKGMVGKSPRNKQSTDAA